MKTTISPRLLVRHAARLAEDGRGRRRPRPTSLRRSTSASYYAVFHAVALAVADQLAPGSTREARQRLTRSLGHDRVKEVCAWLSKPGSGREHSRPILDRLRRNGDVVKFAELFVGLQQARHEADYDHLADVRAAAAVTHYRAALRALALLERLRHTPDGRELLALVALNTALR